MIFFDENLGFTISLRNGGNERVLHKTTDEGQSFSVVNIDTVEVDLDDDTVINPYDCMEVPYIENGVMYMEVGQGFDGDYKGGNKVLYSSLDKGDTWKYEKEIDAQNY